MKNISVPRKNTGQKHFQISSKVYVFVFIMRIKKNINFKKMETKEYVI